MKHLPILCLTAVLATPISASGSGETQGAGVEYLENGSLTYEVFEATIEHVDLPDCPAQFDPESVFCRMTLAADLAHIFVFAYEGDQPLLAIKSYELDGDFLPF